jgi:hypothetical protein
MEININTNSDLYNLNVRSVFGWNTNGTLAVKSTQETLSPLDEIQDYLNAIKEVFLSPDYDDDTRSFVIEDYIIAIQEVLDAN